MALIASRSREVLSAASSWGPQGFLEWDRGCSLTMRGVSADLHFLCVLEVRVCCLGRPLRTGTGGAWRQGTEAHALPSREKHP